MTAPDQRSNRRAANRPGCAKHEDTFRTVGSGWQKAFQYGQPLSVKNGRFLCNPDRGIIHPVENLAAFAGTLSGPTRLPCSR